MIYKHAYLYWVFEGEWFVEEHHLVFVCVFAAADHPTVLTAEQLPQEPGSFRVSWTPPTSLANLTGYRIYYSGAGDSGILDTGASTTEVTIDNRTDGVTYTITMVALSPHLPSPVVGPVTITLGEYFTFVLHIMISPCDGPGYTTSHFGAKYNHSGIFCKR